MNIPNTTGPMIHFFQISSNKKYKFLRPKVNLFKSYVSMFIFLGVAPTSICHFLHLSVRLSVLSSACLPARLSLRPSVHPSIHSSVRPSIHLSVCPSVCASVHQSVHPSVCPFVHPFAAHRISGTVHHLIIIFGTHV